MTHVYIGIDLSKDRLDVFDPRIGRASFHANSAAGIKALFAASKPEDIVVFEATSGCDRLLLEACAKAGRPFVRVNPLHAWHFAQSLNLPKTDRVDARMLARFGSERQLAPHRPQDPARAELAELADRRDQLKRMETQEKNRLSRPLPSFCGKRRSWRTMPPFCARPPASARSRRQVCWPTCPNLATLTDGPSPRWRVWPQRRGKAASSEAKGASEQGARPCGASCTWPPCRSGATRQPWADKPTKCMTQANPPKSPSSLWPANSSPSPTQS